MERTVFDELRDRLTEIEEEVQRGERSLRIDNDRLRAELADARDPDTISRKAHDRLVRLKNYQIESQKRMLDDYRKKADQALVSAETLRQANAGLRETCRTLDRELRQARARAE